MLSEFDSWLMRAMDKLIGPKAKPPPGINPDLYLCPKCESDKAALGDYGEFEDEHWYLHIMCGECHTWRYVEASQDEAEQWEVVALDAIAAVIAREASQLDMDRFKDEAATLIGALGHDLIGPDDFCRHSS